jgi:predicted transcriptional regulator
MSRREGVDKLLPQLYGSELERDIRQYMADFRNHAFEPDPQLEALYQEFKTKEKNGETFTDEQLEEKLEQAHNINVEHKPEQDKDKIS